MKLIILSIFLASSLADKLQNNYLPPANARSAGGSEFLNAPFKNPSTLTRFRTNGQVPSSGQSNSFKNPIAKSAHLETYPGPSIPILRSSNDNNGDGSYRFAYETDNRIVQEEEGHLENVGTDHESNVVRGSYSFQAPDGQVYTVNYIADENGFRATGDHLPTPPPIPEDIQISIEANKAEENNESEFNEFSRSAARGRSSSFNFNKAGKSAAFRTVEDFDDSDSVEVGKPEVDVSRQYLTPIDKQFNQGYRY